MKILSIDTSSKYFSLAVSDDEKIICARKIKAGKILSSAIIPAIKQIIKKSGVISLSKLDGFAVGLGPGSFTSLRVGVSTVKALGFALNKPVVGISSLDVLALNVRADIADVCAICDARRNLVYGCVFKKRGLKIIKKTKYLLTDVKNLLDEIKDDVVFIGDGIEIVKREFEEKGGRNFKGMLFHFEENEKLWYPQARHLAILAFEKMKKKKIDKVEKIVPLYLYPRDCQVRR